LLEEKAKVQLAGREEGKQIPDVLKGDLAMASGTATGNGLSMDAVLRDCACTLQGVAEYRLPAAIDRRLLWLSENKVALSDVEREELLALVQFAEERTVEKLQARASLKQFAEMWPHLVPGRA
jgi:hypothetical protein